MSTMDWLHLERNHYYSGKYLSADDFSAEQQYGSRTRALHNHQVSGAGIVSGFDVTRIDDETIAIGPGYALDALGRPLVLNETRTRKLSAISGFDQLDFANELYLTVALKEVNMGRSIALSDQGEGAGEVVYNRVIEDVTFSLSKEPMPSLFYNAQSLSTNCLRIFEDHRLSLMALIPKYACDHETFDFSIVIIPKTEIKAVSYDLSFQLEGFKPVAPAPSPIDHNDPMVLSLSDKVKDLVPGVVQKTTVAVKADFMSRQVGLFNLLLPTAAVKVEQMAQTGILAVAGTVRKTTAVGLMRLVEAQGDKDILQEVMQLSQCPLYLARLSLTKVRSVVKIDSVEENPFKQWVYSNAMLFEAIREKDGHLLDNLTWGASSVALPPDQEASVAVRYDSGSRHLKFHFGLPKPESTAWPLETGVITLTYQGEKTLVTEAYEHGLGKGATHLEVHPIYIKEDASRSLGEVEVVGDVHLFDQSAFAISGRVSYEIAVASMAETGRFAVAVKPTGLKRGDVIKLRWWAMRKNL